MAKLTVQMTDEMETVLGVLAEQRGLPKTQVLRDAVRLMKYLDDAGRESDLVLRRRTDGTELQIVLETQMRGAGSTQAPPQRPVDSDTPSRHETGPGQQPDHPRQLHADSGTDRTMPEELVTGAGRAL